jgi:glycogen synthase
MLQTLLPNYGYGKPGLVLANGRSGAVFKPAAKQPCILAAGRLWDEGKNLAALESVAPQLAWPVRLAGPTAHPDGGSPWPASVTCLGELPPAALARQLSEAAIYALPARYEPFGLSVLEAGLSGCALVLGDLPSLREVWDTAALYVAPEDTAALQQTLARLIEQPAEIARLGAAARHRARHFTPERMTADYLRAYALLVPAFAARTHREVLCA